MIPEKVARVLTRAGLRALEFEPGSTPTATMAAVRIGVAVGQIAKSLLFRAKNGTYHLVVCAGDKRINSGRLKALVGFKTSMADAEETLAITGFPPGGVCPFGLEGVSIWIDESLAAWDIVYPAAGTDSTGVPTTFEQLITVCGGQRANVTDQAD
ncbi:MAG: YbaK/EbsC family protein [Spirochaetia bacterium]|jgi:prolyl-tRNA editing enzyme YbaK/EbsC (Cys-tRNA(Pro) deacylase)|nr:YbaK/EbsC family protein [Spirochaetia bacterium]